MADAVIRVRELEKLYRVWKSARPTNIKERLRLAGTGVRARAGGSASSTRQEVWALRGVSFDVEAGEVFGVIGPNGAGKSTLLAILARITEPTAGYAEIHGRTSSLLEVGTGFHPELTGRDNVFLNGAILGMTRAETARKFAEIVEFSGIGDFVDLPVKRYSSGMQVRLAFAVAAQLDPEVLLLDEVLAVGDAEFQARCHARVEQITRGGRTVLFVSHDLSSVTRLCRRAIVIERGVISFAGDAEEAVEHYLGSHRGLDSGEPAVREGTGEVRVRSLTLRDEDGGPPEWARPVAAALTFDVAEEVQFEDLEIELTIDHPAGGTYIIASTSFAANKPRGLVTRAAVLTCSLDDLPLRPATYVVGVTITRRGEIVDRAPHAAELVVLSGRHEMIPTTYVAPVFVRHRWEVAESEVVADTIDTRVSDADLVMRGDGSIR